MVAINNQRSATAAYWATCDRIADGDIVPATIVMPHRQLIWRLLAIVPGLMLSGVVIFWAIR